MRRDSGNCRRIVSLCSAVNASASPSGLRWQSDSSARSRSGCTTNYAFTLRIETVQRDAAQVAARYSSAQELLATVRSQVMLSSVRVRDALLDPTPAAIQDCRDQLAASSRAINMALADYQPVLPNASDTGAVARLSDEVAQFHERSLQVLADAAGRTSAQIRDVLSRDIGRHREAAVSISEEIQSINRRAFIEQQAEIAAINRGAEAESRDRIGLALVIGLGTLLLTSAYAGQLESRLRTNSSATPASRASYSKWRRRY